MIAEGGFVHVVFALIKRTAIDKKVVPLTQSEIANELGMSKAKVNSLIGHYKTRNMFHWQQGESMCFQKKQFY